MNDNGWYFMVEALNNIFGAETNDFNGSNARSISRHGYAEFIS